MNGNISAFLTSNILALVFSACRYSPHTCFGFFTQLLSGVDGVAPKLTQVLWFFFPKMYTRVPWILFAFLNVNSLCHCDSDFDVLAQVSQTKMFPQHDVSYLVTSCKSQHHKMKQNGVYILALYLLLYKRMKWQDRWHVLCIMSDMLVWSEQICFSRGRSVWCIMYIWLD